MKIEHLLLIGLVIFGLWIVMICVVMNYPELLGGLEYHGYEYGFMVGLLILFENISTLPWWWQVVLGILSMWPLWFAEIADSIQTENQTQIKLDELEKKLKEPLNR